MTKAQLPGRLGQVAMDGELPRRSDLGLIFDELDYQMATQAYLWALPLVSYAQWFKVHRELFGATNFDLVHYVTYRDRLGLITANATTPYLLNFIDLGETGPLVIELPPAPTAGGVSDFWQREICRPVLRAGRARRPWVALGPDGSRPALVLLFPLLRTHGVVFRSDLEGRRRHSRRVTDTGRHRSIVSSAQRRDRRRSRGTVPSGSLITSMSEWAGRFGCAPEAARLT